MHQQWLVGWIVAGLLEHETDFESKITRTLSVMYALVKTISYVLHSQLSQSYVPLCPLSLMPVSIISLLAQSRFSQLCRSQSNLSESSLSQSLYPAVVVHHFTGARWRFAFMQILFVNLSLIHAWALSCTRSSFPVPPLLHCAISSFLINFRHSYQSCF